MLVSRLWLPHLRPLAVSSAPLQVVVLRRFASSIGDASEEDLKVARQWLASFTPDTIPRGICEVTFSRSSGPGGQNVNKVNSKATLRVPLSSLLRQIPLVLHEPIRASRYTTTSDSLTIQSDDSRKQSDNTHSCFVKLHDLIIEAGRDAVPGETSEAQKKRVIGLQKSANESRLRLKKKSSDKKSSRRGGKSGGDY